MSDSAISKHSPDAAETLLFGDPLRYRLIILPLGLSLLSLSRRSSLISKYVEFNPLLFVAITILWTVTVTKYLSYEILKTSS